MKRVLALVTTSVLCVLGNSSVLAQRTIPPPPQLLQDCLDWLQEPTHMLSFRLVSIRPSDGQVTYVEGNLKIGYHFINDRSVNLWGTGQRYFSDHLFFCPDPKVVQEPKFPFSPYRTEEVDITVNTLAGGTTLKSPSQTITIVPDRYTAGVLYYFRKSRSPREQELYLILVKKIL